MVLGKCVEEHLHRSRGRRDCIEGFRGGGGITFEMKMKKISNKNLLIPEKNYKKKEKKRTLHNPT